MTPNQSRALDDWHQSRILSIKTKNALFPFIQLRRKRDASKSESECLLHGQDESKPSCDVVAGLRLALVTRAKALLEDT